ncbi:MAG TPA: glycosyltransferase [Pyrinomonadaceae bacterium]|nr:glycosyltransferase [Pyrinomonadaceae bacterium]
MRTLYLCYFGVREPLVRTQVLPYLRELARGGVGVSLLTFEPELKGRWTAEALEEERSRLEADGIRWFALPYHKRPSVPATVYDIFAGAWFAARHARREGVDVLHARAHVPAAMAMLARVLVPRLRFVFDIRGLMAEEYADAGVWAKGSPPFRAVKWLERAAVERADRIVVLTRVMRDWLVKEKLAPAEKIEVIPCCVDFSRYAEGAEGKAAESEKVEGDAAKDERFEVVYAGSATGLYMLEEMGRFFAELRALRPGAFFRVLTMSPPEEVRRVLRGAGLKGEDFHVGRASASEVPAYLGRARLGVSFRKATFSQIAASPTKIPEYLAAGLPVVSNAGIGDTDEVLEREAVGVLVQRFHRESYARAAEEALALADDPSTPARCLAAARRHFDLAAVGGARYLNVYRRLSPQTGDAATPSEGALTQKSEVGSRKSEGRTSSF